MDPSRTTVQGLAGRPGTIFLAILFVGFLISEIRFSLTAKHGQAAVISSYQTPKGGPRIALVEHRFDNQKIQGEIVVSFWHPHNGEVFATVYSPSDPTRPQIDFFWRRYMYLMITGSFLLVVAIAEVASRQSKRRSEDLERRFAF